MLLFTEKKHGTEAKDQRKLKVSPSDPVSSMDFDMLHAIHPAVEPDDNS
jgi:hypothetical protein